MNESFSAAQTRVKNRINRIDSNDSYVYFGLFLHNNYRVAPENLE